ncbi:hypothetical protein, partial [Proteus terrae]|uniref:hypothetical protein n=1 Tax=Proteus terrae TaxID=1574161 RepID=UPI001F32CB17
YVPTIEQIKKNLIIINFSAYGNRENFYNTKIEKYPLKVSREDVRCIYIQNENEKKKIMSIFNFTDDQVIIAPWQKAK